MTHGTGLNESSIQQRSNPNASAPRVKRVRVSEKSRAGSKLRREHPPRPRKRAGVPGMPSWAAACTVIALVLGLSTLAVLSSYDVNRGNLPSDVKLTANFFSHETAFDELVLMLASDHFSLAAKGPTRIDMEALGRLDTSAVRSMMYRGLLRQISVEDLRYFPYSGKLVLVPDGQENLDRPSKTYLYLPHAQPQSFIRHHGYSWRGPGVYILTSDHPLKGSWFIHHDMTMEVAVAPY